MKRNSTTLYLQSPGSITPVPWVNGAPDFSGFTEPTLSVLQRSWAVFLASQEELEIVADPEPIVEPVQPDWQGWQLAMLSDPNWTPVANAGGHLTSALYVFLDQLEQKPETLNSIIAVWPMISAISNVTEGQRDIWRGVAESFDLPAGFVAVI